MNKEIMRNAMIEYARDQYFRNRDPYSAEQWVTVMNCYARHDSTQVCADSAGMSRNEAALLYCRMAIAVTERALQEAHQR